MHLSSPARQCASAVLMVAPTDFEFNEQTRHDNEFQQRLDVPTATVRQRAMVEFDAMVARLRAEGVVVVVLPPRGDGDGAKTPDAVFPNNWLGVDAAGTLTTYPMAMPNRREERRIEAAETALVQAGFQINNVLNVGRWRETNHFLEGTGSMVIDHVHDVVYAAASERCHAAQLDNCMRLRGSGQALWFETASRSGRSVYHTNVMLSVGAQCAVVCDAAIVDPSMRARVVASLGRHRAVVSISLAQMEDSFCGNILELRGHDDAPLWVLSERAHDGFTQAQRAELARHARLVPVPLDTIETVGGGSARCMLAEIFAPHASLEAPPKTRS